MKYEEIREYLLFNCSLQIGYYKSKNDNYKFAIFDIDSQCPKYKFNTKKEAINYMYDLYNIIIDFRNKNPEEDRILHLKQVIFFN